MKKRMAVVAALLLCQAIWLGGCGAGKESGSEAVSKRAEDGVLTDGAEEESREIGDNAAPDSTETATSAAADESETESSEAPDGEGPVDDPEMADIRTGVMIPARFQDGVNGFALRFTRQMLEEKGEAENLIVSPFSVWLPLTALANASDGEAMEDLLSALGLSGADMTAQNALTEQMIRSLQQEERRKLLQQYGENMDSPLKIANALFVGKDVKPQKEFASVFSEVYQGRIFTVDFTDGDAVERINAWGSEQTDGKIEKLISELDPETVAALANAVYFSDSWTDPFSEDLTKDDLFRGAGGGETVPFMNGEFDHIPYYAGQGYEMAALPTQNGGRLMLLLPAEGKTASGDLTGVGMPAGAPAPEKSAEEVLAALDSQELGRLQEAERTAVQLSLPRFRVESDTFSVLEALESMGVPLSDDMDPHIDGLAQERLLYLSQAVQKAVLETDEEGLTAAAVTAMMMAEGAFLEPQDPIVLKFDRPFAFLLTADGGDAGPVVLFSGVVNQIG